MRNSWAWVIIAATLGLIGPATGAPAAAQSSAGDASMAITGAWTLNRDLSDRPQDRPPDGDRPARDGDGRQGGGRGRGGGRGGGLGGGFGGGRGGDADDRQRVRDAMRDLMNPPERLTITRTASMVIIAAGDGRVTRLSPDGKKIKDESTKIERRTKWDGDTLVTEIDGLGPRKITETYRVDPTRKQLFVTVQLDNRDRPMTVTHVYDALGAGTGE